MNLDQDGVTVKGISPRVMWPSDASTCQRRRYAPATKPVASAESVSAGLGLLISSARAEPSGWMSVRRERSASMRTLKRSLIGTSGPDTALFKDGLDSRRTACAAAGPTVKKAAATANNMSAQRIRGPGCMTFLFGKNAKGSVKARFRLPRENYTEAGVDCYFIRAPPGQGIFRGPRMSERNPPARPRLKSVEINPAN